MTGYLRAADRSTDQLADRAVWDNSPNPSGERLDQPVSGGYGQGGWTARDLTPAERLEQARANAAGKREEQDYMTQTELHANFTPPPTPSGHKGKVVIYFVASGLIVTGIIVVTILGIKGIA